jgi:bifunctional non-homologous end joining protein LigD
MTEKTVTLYSTENGSDKVYKTEVVSHGDGWVVNFWFGPRTGTLQSGTKTKSPVSKDEALKIWEKLVREKRAKGYHEGADAPAYTESDGTTRDTGLRPMLLTPASMEQVEHLIEDREWCAQEKLNGKRIMIIARKGKVIAANRRGLECPIPKEVAGILGRFNFVIDGELVGSSYIPFDLLETGNKDYRNEGYGLRFHVLWNLLGHSQVQPAPYAAKPELKRELIAKLRDRNAEGIVLKKLEGAGYSAGKVESLAKAHAVKVKFYASAECVVTGWNRGRQSVALGTYDAQGTLVPVGNVTVPAKYATDISVGRVVQVRYLYATPAHQLYQPTLDGSSGSVVREDKPATECLLAQLKYEGND